MAGTLLHVTLAERALYDAPIDPQQVAEIKKHMDDFYLGAVLVDLPYYERLVGNGLRILAHLDVPYATWGTRLHLCAPALLGQTLLSSAQDPAARALALGLLTHLAVDEIFHREIHRRTVNRTDTSISDDAAHKQLEDQMDLHVHYHFLQHPGIGTPYARRKLALKPHGAWATRVRGAILQIHGTAPEEKRLIHWLRLLRLFGILCSTKYAPWITTLPDDNPELLKTSVRLADESVRLAATYLQAGLDYVDGDLTADGFAEIIPNRSLLDGGPAEPPVNVTRAPGLNR